MTLSVELYDNVKIKINSQFHIKLVTSFKSIVKLKGKLPNIRRES